VSARARKQDLLAAAAARTAISDADLYLFAEGRHLRVADMLGAHPLPGGAGTRFAVWAPNAREVSVLADSNGWTPGAAPLAVRGPSGVWEGIIPGIAAGDAYKFHIASHHDGYRVDKADPVAIRAEHPPRTASVVWDLDYAWGDAEWMARRREASALDAPITIYELHLGSWRRVPGEDDRPLTYREIAPLVAEHVTRLGFTHVELLPVTEHPFYGSWGYQTTGYFAPTARYGTPQDFMALVDILHQAGIAVILDWVPAHFPADEHGLGYFDGTHLYEHADPREGEHPDWGSLIFNFGRHEVRSFLLSSALFWLERYHLDGLRVDAVASMLYRDYSREGGEWIPNAFGGRENLEAISFLREFNEDVYRLHPDVQTYAEESTAWPMVSRPTYLGGLGFGYKWDMGWMHDTLEYVHRDPIHRRHHHGELTFRAIYAFNENFVLPLSHDEVVHGKGSLLEGMPGDPWQKAANLRALYAYQFTLPGKKLLFMGDEFGQWREWHHERSLDWHLIDEPLHGGLMRCVGDLAHLYRELPALHSRDCDPGGFEWIEAYNAEQSVIAYLRRGPVGEMALVVINFTPVPWSHHRLGVDYAGRWDERFNSDAAIYGGSGHGNLGALETVPVPSHDRPHSLVVSVPPLGALVFVPGTPASDA
jgi:1,4-alpha-glucan branching enzyme